MPETTIGLFPDVGGGYFLSRLQGALGTFLALTSHRLQGGRRAVGGHCRCPCAERADGRSAGRIGRSRSRRSGRQPQGRRGDRQVRRRSRTAPVLPALMHDIDRCFSAESVAEIVAKLKKHPGEWAEKQLAALMKLSPLSMAITLEQLRRCANRSFEDTMTIEYRMSQHVHAARPRLLRGRARLADRQGPEAEVESADHRRRDARRWSRRISSRSRTTCSSTEAF